MGNAHTYIDEMHIIRSIDAYRFIEIAHGSNAHKGI
jgi:hypothetical protein